MSGVRVVECDGSVASARSVSRAMIDALGGGPAVLPVPAEPPGVRDRLIAAARPDLDCAAAALVATSGTAAGAKLVELPAAVLVASAEATHERLGGPGHWLLALPPLHVAGLQVLVRAALAGIEPAVLDLRGGFRPDAFAAGAAGAAAAGQAPVRRYTALVPTQLTRLLDAGGAALDALRGFDAVLVGGAATPPVLADRAQAAGVRIVITYGMTETAGGCVYDGHPLSGVRVRLDGERRVLLGGTTLASGYRLRPDLTAAAFRPGWFRSDDLGLIGPDGAVRILGRVDDVIVTGGRKVPPALVESALDASPDVAESCVVGLPDPAWGQLVAAAVVASRGHRPDVEALRGEVRAAAGPAAVPRLIAVVGELPRRGIGKVDRAAVQRYLIEQHAASSPSVQ